MKKIILAGLIAALVLALAFTPVASAQAYTYSETSNTNEDGVFHHGNYHLTEQPDGTRLDVQHTVDRNLPAQPGVTILSDKDTSIHNSMTGNGEVFHLTWKTTTDNQGDISELRVVQTNVNGETIVQNVWVDGKKV